MGYGLSLIGVFDSNKIGAKYLAVKFPWDSQLCVVFDMPKESRDPWWYSKGKE